MGYPTTTEGQSSLNEENIDAQRAILAIMERFRALDAVPTLGSLGTGVSAASLVANSNDDRGGVTFTVATGGTGTQLVLTFSKAWAEGVRFPVIDGANAAAAAQETAAQISATCTSTAMTFNCGVALPNGTYTFNYFIR